MNISKTESGMFEMQYDTPDGTKTVLSKSIALTVPSYVAANLLQEFSVSAKLSRTVFSAMTG